jgi:hypothetical protein
MQIVEKVGRISNIPIGGFHMESGSVFTQAQGMSQGEGQKIDMPDMTEGAGQTGALAKLPGFAEAGRISGKQHRDGVPGMAFELGRSGMVAGDQQNIRFEGQQRRQGLIDRLNDMHTLGVFTIFTIAVGLFDVDEEKVVFIPVLANDFELFQGCFCSVLDHIHTYQSGNTFVHRIDRDRSRAHLENFRERL